MKPNPSIERTPAALASRCRSCRTLGVNQKRMSTSEVVKAVDWVQQEVRPLLKQCGYKAKGRTFNRITSDGLTQVVNF